MVTSCAIEFISKKHLTVSSGVLLIWNKTNNNILKYKMEYKIYKFRVYDKDNNFIETKSIESVDYNLAIKRLRRVYPYMTKFIYDSSKD